MTDILSFLEFFFISSIKRYVLMLVWQPEINPIWSESMLLSTYDCIWYRNLHSSHLIQGERTAIGRNSYFWGKLGYTLFNGIRRASNDIGDSNCSVSEFHQSFMSTLFVVFLNHLSLKPSNVTALFEDILFCIYSTISVPIYSSLGKL